MKYTVYNQRGEKLKDIMNEQAGVTYYFVADPQNPSWGIAICGNQDDYLYDTYGTMSIGHELNKWGYGEAVKTLSNVKREWG
jgi:hypothetical protein